MTPAEMGRAEGSAFGTALEKRVMSHHLNEMFKTF
jgi:hypothetical protein